LHTYIKLKYQQTHEKKKEAVMTKNLKIDNCGKKKKIKNQQDLWYSVRAKTKYFYIYIYIKVKKKMRKNSLSIPTHSERNTKNTQNFK